MDRRFGLKDALTLLLILGVGASVWLSMMQEDRRWREMRDLRAALLEQTQTLSAIRSTLESRAAAAPATNPASATPAANAGAALSGDQSWARTGVTVTRPGPWEFSSDPRALPGFAEGGTLNEALEGNPAKITPYVHNDFYYLRIVNESVCESLANFDSRTLELRGWLAEAWQQDPEGLWLRVKIDDRARFSDGTPVTAEDVRFTFMDYVLNPQVQADAHRSLIAIITDVKVISDRVVEFAFREARYNSINAALRNPILPRGFYSRFTPSQLNQSTGLLMGSGPYRLERLDPDDQWRSPQPLLLVRNENYWGRRPPIDRVRFVFIADPLARLTALENGEVDFVRAQPAQFRRKADEPAFTEKFHTLAWTNMRSGYAFLAWNCADRNGRPTPFADKRVRQAMTLMIDRDRVARDFFEGLATIAVGPFTPTQSDPSIQPWPFDLDRAGSLLSEAGWSDRDGDGLRENSAGEPLTFEYLYASGGPIGERMGKYLIDQGARVGARVSTKVVDFATMRALRTAHDFDSFVLAWSWSAPESDVYQLFHSSQAIGEGDNWIQWRDPRADALIELARITIDSQKRREVWHRLHRLIHDEQPFTFLYNQPWLYFVSKRIQNVHAYPAGLDRREMFIPSERQ